MDNDLISVIMPAYNSEEFISTSIDSVLRQTYSNWELIIIDDGSTDNTAAIIQSYLTDQRIIYHYQTNAKQGLARNKGIELSNGEFIAFLDSDDLWLPERLAVTLAEFRSADQDLLFTDAYIFDGPFNIEDIPAEQAKFGVADAAYHGQPGLIKFLEYNRIPTLTTLIRRDIFRITGPFSDRSICEDYEMWLKMLISGGKLRSTGRTLSAYRQHKNSTTAKDRLAIDDCIDVISSLKKDPKTALFTETITKYLKKWHIKKIDKITNNFQLKAFLNIAYFKRPLSRFFFQFLCHFIPFFRFNKKVIRYLINKYP